jgi:D-3-phosphoglycerate dehydrogenase
MRPYRIALAAGTFTDSLVEKDRIGSRADVTLVAVDTPDQIRAATAEADALIVTNHLLDGDRIAALGSGVRVIGRAGIGLDAIDLVAARRRGIAVLHVPDYATNEVAIHAIAMMLAVHRRLSQADRVARCDWLNWRQIGPIEPLDLLTVGIIGYGRIGRAVARRLSALVRFIMVYDPQVNAVDPPATSAPTLVELLANSDIVMIHASLVRPGAPLLDDVAIAQMRPASILVNVARGGLIDEAALARALAEGRIAGAGLDVLQSEPPAADNVLLTAPNVLVSPHVAWYSTGSERRARADTVAGVIEFLDGLTVESAVLAVIP